MFAAIVAFFVSAASTLFVIRTTRLHGSFSADSDLTGPQKMHVNVVPRIGGIGIVLGVLAGWTALWWRYGDVPAVSALLLVICALPAFVSGLVEDMTKRVGPRWRLIATMQIGRAHV